MMAAKKAKTKQGQQSSVHRFFREKDDGKQKSTRVMNYCVSVQFKVVSILMI